MARHLAQFTAVALGTPTLALGQPCAWEALDGATFSGKIRALEEFDEGSGPRLFVGGGFSWALGSPASNIARWDGETWTPLGSGLGGSAYALDLFDDGMGEALYAGGPFARAGEIPDANGIARWDGAEWSTLGTGLYNEDPVHAHIGAALAVFDDGTGPALYVGGNFTEVGGAPAINIARWDGRDWSAVGEGIGGTPGVRALAVFDDGLGPALYAGGYILGRLMRWDGHVWAEVGIPGFGNIETMIVFDDGSGPALYAGGQNAAGLGRWDGEQWSVVGGGTDYTVRSLHVFDDGSGAALFVGGAFHHAGGKQVFGIAKWDGREWHDLDGGVYHERGMSVGAMTTFDDGTGPALYVAGKFDSAGGPGGIPVQNIARWRCEGGCYADCDGDGELTFFDFLCFQNLFAAMDPAADCDESGQLDFFDFLCFQNAFAAGCE